MSHSLPPELARMAVRKAVESYQERFAKYSPDVRWEGEDRASVSFSAKGMTLGGSVRLEPNAIVFDMQVPFLLKPLAGKATGVLEREVKKWVGAAEKGEL